MPWAKKNQLISFGMFSAHVHELYGSVEHHTWLPTSSSVWGLPKKVLVVLSNLLVTGSIDVNWIRYLNSLWIHVKHPPKINTCLQAHGGFPQPQPPPPLHAAFKPTDLGNPWHSPSKPQLNGRETYFSGLRKQKFRITHKNNSAKIPSPNHEGGPFEEYPCHETLAP